MASFPLIGNFFIEDRGFTGVIDPLDIIYQEKNGVEGFNQPKDGIPDDHFTLDDPRNLKIFGLSNLNGFGIVRFTLYVDQFWEVRQRGFRIKSSSDVDNFVDNVDSLKATGLHFIKKGEPTQPTPDIDTTIKKAIQSLVTNAKEKRNPLDLVQEMLSLRKKWKDRAHLLPSILPLLRESIIFNYDDPDALTILKEMIDREQTFAKEAGATQKERDLEMRLEKTVARKRRRAQIKKDEKTERGKTEEKDLPIISANMKKGDEMLIAGRYFEARNNYQLALREMEIKADLKKKIRSRKSYADAMGIAKILTETGENKSKPEYVFDQEDEDATWKMVYSTLSNVTPADLPY